jgi:hypothetical protein
MKTRWMTAAAVALNSIVVSGIANAEEKDEAQGGAGKAESLRPVKRAVELTIGTGYMQGFGNIASRQPSLTDLGTAGGGVQGGVGYRIIPRLTIGAYGSWGMFGRGDQADPTGNLYTATAGGEATWHILPDGYEFAPWVSLGTGWRGYWMTGNQGTTATHGWEIAKLQVGIDYRMTRDIAISPVVGLDLTTFFTQSTPASQGFQNIQNPNVNTFLFAGLQGRFDIPTSSDSSSHVASR